MKDLGIYIHIPFCVKKCRYCDFLSFNKDDNMKKAYIEALKKEIQLYSVDNSEGVSSIYIGGGTPSCVDGIYIEEILNEVRTHFNVLEDVEITIEVNPGTVTKDKVSAYKRVGINRISIGLQSTHNDELKMLGRIHNYEEFLETYRMFRAESFDNISVDVMSAIPNQTVESYRETLNRIIQLKPEHISSYSLIIEENTPFYKEQDSLKLVDEDTERQMYYMTKEILENSGYKRYEISNYAMEGKESRHNNRYWDVTKSYLGLGLGASSYVINMVDTKENYTINTGQNNIQYNKINNVFSSKYKIKNIFIELMDDSIVAKRFNKINNINEYIAILNSQEDILSGAKRGSVSLRQKLECDVDLITFSMLKEEYMFLGLRRIEGVSISKFEKLHNIISSYAKEFNTKDESTITSYKGENISCDNEENTLFKESNMYNTYGTVIDKYINMGLLVVEGDRMYLSDEGIDVCNTIFVDFINE
ncbi:MAG: radical SAM family heme chaperone HemW [Lachnospiraceae bacterium]|nr:radical SAM family heme chaperone HemW [Lachnospiraceae bacterium]